jgi:hypothetical protein
MSLYHPATIASSGDEAEKYTGRLPAAALKTHPAVAIWLIRNNFLMN